MQFHTCVINFNGFLLFYLICFFLQNTVVFGKGDKCRPFSSLLEDDMSLFPKNLVMNVREDVFAIPFSSGTTGLPKGVMLTHYNLLANVLQTRFVRPM